MRCRGFWGIIPSARDFIERLMQKPVPASYGQASYLGEHAFRFTASDDTSRFGRYHWVPEAGEAYLSPDEASTRNANFLREELESRMRARPVVFRLLLQLLRRAIRRTTSPAYGRQTGPWSNWGGWRSPASLLRVLPTNAAWCSIPPI